MYRCILVPSLENCYVNSHQKATKYLFHLVFWIFSAFLTLHCKCETENKQGGTFPSPLRHVFCIRGRGLASQEGSPQRRAGPEPAEPRLLDQPLRPKLVHVLVRLLHPLPWRAQEPAAAAAWRLPAGRRSGPHAHRYGGLTTSWTAAVAPRASQRLPVCVSPLQKTASLRT